MSEEFDKTEDLEDAELQYATTRSMMPGPLKKPPGRGWTVQHTFEPTLTGSAMMIYVVWTRFESDDQSEHADPIEEGDVHLATLDRCIGVCDRLVKQLKDIDGDEPGAAAVDMTKRCIAALKD